MAWLEWVIVGIVVAVSAVYSVWRLLPRKRGRNDSGCKTCPAHTTEPGGKPPTRKPDALPR